MKTRMTFYACLAAGLALFGGIRVAALMLLLLAITNTILAAILGRKGFWKTAGQSLAIRSLLSLGLVPLAWLAARILAGKAAIILLGVLAAAGLALSLRAKKNASETVKAEPWAIVVITALVVALTWIPFSRIGSTVDGRYAYRAYFSSDYLKHLSTVESLNTGILPPPNLYFNGEALHYYWLPYVVPALVSRFSGSTSKAMFGFSFCVNFLFVLLLLLTGQKIYHRRKGIPYLVLGFALAPSLEGFYIWAAKARFSLGSYLQTAGNYNVDGLTRFIWGLPQIDAIFRSMLFTPQHLLSLAFLLLFLFYAGDESEENAPALALSLALSFVSSFFIGGLLFLVWGPYTIVGEGARVIRKEIKIGTALRRLTNLFVFPVAAVALSLVMKMMSPGGNKIGVVILRPSRIAVELGLNYGFLIAAGIAALLAVRFPGRGFQALLLAVALACVLFVRIVNFESDISLKFGLVVGLLLALLSGRLAEAPKAGRLVWPIALVVILLGLMTLTADIRNSADVQNRRFTSYVPSEEMALLKWAKKHIPPEKTVQNFPEGRTWNLSTIPPFSGRQMVVGDRSHGQIFQVSPELYERRIEALRAALAGLPQTRDDLRRLGVDYLFWGEDEKRLFKLDPGFPVACRFGETVLYSVGRE
jgi:hypothetical protein